MLLCIKLEIVHVKALVGDGKVTGKHTDENQIFEEDLLTMLAEGRRGDSGNP